MEDKGYDCIADGIMREDKTLINPCYLIDDKYRLNIYYPFEVINSMSMLGNDLAVYESPDLNCYTTVAYLDQIINPENSAELFRYRIKEKYTPDGLTVHTHPAGNLPSIFCFELNVMNIFMMTKKSCIILRDPQKMALLRNAAFWETYNDQTCARKLREIAYEYVDERL